jgi:hypothetical protein
LLAVLGVVGSWANFCWVLLLRKKKRGRMWVSKGCLVVVGHPRILWCNEKNCYHLTKGSYMGEDWFERNNVFFFGKKNE